MTLDPDHLTNQKIEIFGASFDKKTVGSVTFLQPLEVSAQLQDEINQYSQLILATKGQLSAINQNTELPQQYIIFCDPDLYWKRFEKKAIKDGFNPEPWKWSEGDIDDVQPFGKVFCIKLSAGFRSNSEKERFIAHELAHPIINNRAPLIGELLADNEGIVEAEARIGLEIQLNQDYQYSTEFILSLTENELVLPEEINRLGYDHPAFYGKLVSESHGYASCFLWFFGIALKISNYSQTDSIREKYLEGKEIIISIAKNSLTTDEYKKNLFEFGINYDVLSQDITFLSNAQKQFGIFTNG